MTFLYTDEQLNYMNRGNYVYSVNPKYVKNHQEDNQPPIRITENPNDDDGTNILRTPDNQQFQVIATKSDPKTGFDGMAVAPIVNGKPDYNQVAIIAAGTDPKTIDVNTALSDGIDKNGNPAIYPSHLSIQYQVALQFVNSIKEDPRYRVVQLSGYSQGAYMIKIGALYGIPTTTFNAWFRYNSLTDAEINFIRENPHLFRDYRNNQDYVVLFHDDNQPHHYGYYDAIGSIRWVNGSSHKIDDWYFDPVTGQTLDGKGGRPLVTSVSYYQSISTMQMKQFASLKSQWKKSGGKLSSSEKIFLDAIQAQMLGANMASSARSGAEEASLLQTKAIQDVQDVWNKIDFSSYTELTPWEVEAAFTSYGVTRDFVSEFQTESQEMVEKMMASAEQFDTLKTQLDQAIASLQEADSQLAGDFKAWEQGM